MVARCQLQVLKSCSQIYEPFLKTWYFGTYVKGKNLRFNTVWHLKKQLVTPQNVIIAAKCNINAKCNKNRRKM